MTAYVLLLALIWRIDHRERSFYNNNSPEERTASKMLRHVKKESRGSEFEDEW